MYKSSSRCLSLLQEYTVADFTSETVTRSGYQIRRKNMGVAFEKGEKLYTLVARYDLPFADIDKGLGHVCRA